MSDSSPEKRQWQKREGNKSRKHSRKQKRSGRKSDPPLKDMEQLRQPEEPVRDCIKRLTDSGILVGARSLYSCLLLQRNTDELKGAVIMQYQLARRLKRNMWINDMRLNCSLDLPDDWVEQNLPSMDNRPLPKPKKSSAGSYVAESSRDMRLESNPDLPVFRANAADDTPLEPLSGDPQSVSHPGPNEESQEEVKMEVDVLPTPEPVITTEISLDKEPVTLPSTEPDVPTQQGGIVVVEVEPAAVSTETETVSWKALTSTVSRKQSLESGLMDPRANPDTFSGGIRRTAPETGRQSRQPLPTRVVVPDSRDSSRKVGVTQKRSLSITVSANANRPGIKVAGATPPTQDFTYCPLKSCDSTDKRLKRHVLTNHFPPALTFVADSREKLEQQISALRWLVRTTFGSRATLQDAVDWLNDSNMVPRTIALNPVHEDTFLDACKVLGTRPPRKFTLHPINSPAVLLFWRCTLAILTRCSPADLREFYFYERPGCHQYSTSDRSSRKPLEATTSEREVVSHGRPNVPSRENMFVREVRETRIEIHTESDSEDTGDFVVLDEISDEEETVNDSQLTASSLPKVFDSHFHLDRSCLRIWKTAQGYTVEDLIAYSFSHKARYQPSVKVEVVGGIIVHSEPRTYPAIDFSLRGPWKVAVGVHPKHFDTLTVERTMVLQRLLSHPKVVALGECGLDRTVSVSQWSRQEEVFKRMLRLARVDQPLILHLRGPTGDEYGSDVHSRCLLMMEGLCDRNQLVHVHCFTGKAEIVEAWIRKFPRVYFGITAAVRSFDQEQIAGLRAIPGDKLLLETDAPYFPLGNATVSTPAYLGEVAAILAVHLDQRPPELMSTTLHNARTLYGQ